MTKTLADLSPTLRSLLPEVDEHVSYIVDGSGPGGTFVPGVDDLREEIKVTLGDYLSCLTAEGKNTYQVDGGSSPVSLSDSSGNPSPVGTGGTNSQKFAGDLSSWTSRYLDVKSQTRLSSYLSKGKPDLPETESGHTLLRSVVGSSQLGESSGRASSTREGDTPLEKQVSQVLRTNRFNPTAGSTPYVPEGQIPTVVGKVRSTLGTSSGGTDLTSADLSKIGASLLLMGAGGAGDTDPDSSSGLFLGEGVQLGVNRIPRVNLNTRESGPLRGIPRTSLESDLTLDGGDPELYSYGHVNTPTAPFGGFVPLGMIALGGLMTTTMIVGAEVIFSVLALIVNTDGKSVRLDPGPYVAGQYGRPEADGLLSTLVGPRALGLIHTENDYFDCARRGANIFFGFSGDNLASAAEEALLNIVQSPGFYVVTVRNILRSLNTISNALRDINFSNPVSGAQAVLGVIDVIRSSKIVAFFNACAALGDIAISEEGRLGTLPPGQKGGSSLQDSIDDRVTDGTYPLGVSQVPGTSVMKSRSKSGSTALSLAWRSSAAPAMYVLPRNLVNASIDFGPNTSLAEGLLGGYHGDKFRLTDGGRLTASDVKEMEDVLEAEYVPFYFHDLRTNEVISFHAFLKTLNDGYTANYEQTDGYGRIDSVNVYKSTKRSIDMSFVVASTSEEDFDEMWWKVNKLVTLLYPQWGSGRSLESATTGARFVQPLSQVPTASPLARIRVGDVVRSNGSRFNLARTFGLGGKDPTGFSPVSGFAGSDIDPEKMSKVKSVLKTMVTDPDLSGTSNESDGFGVGDLAILKPTLVGHYMEATPTGNLLQKAVAVVTKGSARRKVRIPAEVSVTVSSREVKQLDRTKLNLSTEAKTVYVVTLNDEIPGVTTEGITELEVTHADLKVDPGYVLVKSEMFTAEQIESVAAPEVADFFSSEGNYVVRSFESVVGRGLAGVITSVSFDWITHTWETSPGRRAPKSCEVSLSFSPIHDVPPGLDDAGFNRAPVYPVGSLVRSVSGDVHDSAADEMDLLVRQIYLKFAKVLSQVQGG